MVVTSGKLKEQLLQRDSREAIQSPSLFLFHVLTKILGLLYKRNPKSDTN